MFNDVRIKLVDPLFILGIPERWVVVFDGVRMASLSLRLFSFNLLVILHLSRWFCDCFASRCPHLASCACEDFLVYF